MMGTINSPFRSLSATCERKRFGPPRSPPLKSGPWHPRQSTENRVLPRAICAGSPGGRFCPGTNPPLRAGWGGGTLCVAGGCAVCASAIRVEESTNESKQAPAIAGFVKMFTSVGTKRDQQYCTQRKAVPISRPQESLYACGPPMMMKRKRGDTPGPWESHPVDQFGRRVTSFSLPTGERFSTGCYASRLLHFCSHPRRQPNAQQGSSGAKA